MNASLSAEKPAELQKDLSGSRAEDGTFSVLFVCTGNTCRSPMAAAVLNHLGASRGFIASSAGLYPAPGSAISQNAALALGQRGIPAERDNRYDLHKAVRVNDDMIKSCDRVVGITSSHAIALLGAFPYAADKICAMPRDISDPFGGSLEDYLRCLDEITQCIKEMFSLDV